MRARKNAFAGLIWPPGRIFDTSGFRVIVIRVTVL